VRNEEIEIIKKSILDIDIFDVSIFPYKKGDRIKLETGLFSNQDAVIKEVSNTHYILVLESLGCVLKMKHNRKNTI
jgi:transcription antitermination factor NusG